MEELLPAGNDSPSSLTTEITEKMENLVSPSFKLQHTFDSMEGADKAEESCVLDADLRHKAAAQRVR